MRGNKGKRWTVIGCCCLSGLLTACDSDQAQEPEESEFETARTIPNTFPDMAQVRLEEVSIRVTEDQREARIGLIRSVVLDIPVEVEFDIVEGEAHAGDDFTMPEVRRVVFEPGDSRASINVEILDDFDYERGAETFLLRLSAITGGELVGPLETLITIVDNDEAPKPAKIVGRKITDAGAVTYPAQGYGKVAVTNEGGQPAIVERVNISGNGFTILRDECNGRELLPASICEISWQLNPLELPGYYEAQGLLTVALAAQVETLVLTQGVMPAAKKKVANAGDHGPADNAADDARQVAVNNWMTALLRGEASQSAGKSGSGRKSSAAGSRDDGTEVPPATAILAQETIPDAESFTYPLDRSRMIAIDQVIGCLLIDAASNELGDTEITCQVDRPVYAASGRKVLLPSFSKIKGRLQRSDNPAATRLGLVMETIIHGRTGAIMHLPEPLQGLDTTGRAGLVANIHENMFAPYTNALLTTGVGLLANLGTQQGLQAVDIVDQTSIQNAQNTIAQTFAELAAEDLENRNKYRRTLFLDQASARVLIRPTVPLVFPEAVLGMNRTRLTDRSQAGTEFRILTLEQYEEEQTRKAEAEKANAAVNQ